MGLDGMREGRGLATYGSGVYVVAIVALALVLLGTAGCGARVSERIHADRYGDAGAATGAAVCRTASGQGGA